MKKVSAGARKLARDWFRRNGRAGKPVCEWDLWSYDHVYGLLNGAFEYAHENGNHSDGTYFHRLIMKLLRSRMPRVPRNQQQKEAA